MIIRQLAQLALVATVAGVAAGCPPIETKIPSSTTVTVPGTGITPRPQDIFPAELVGAAISEAINQSFDTSGYDKARVESLKLTTLTMTVLDPTTPQGVKIRHLGMLQKLTLSLGGIKVAESADGAFAEQPIFYEMPLTDAEVAEAFKASDALEMSSEVVVGEPIFTDTEVTIDSEITAQITIL